VRWWPTTSFCTAPSERPSSPVERLTSPEVGRIPAGGAGIGVGRLVIVGTANEVVVDVASTLEV
jgi:hypothetical protein